MTSTSDVGLPIHTAITLPVFLVAFVGGVFGCITLVLLCMWQIGGCSWIREAIAAIFRRWLYVLRVRREVDHADIPSEASQGQVDLIELA